MITKAQAFRALKVAMGRDWSPSFDLNVIRQFIEQSRPPAQGVSANAVPENILAFLDKRQNDTYSCKRLCDDLRAMLSAAPQPVTEKGLCDVAF